MFYMLINRTRTDLSPEQYQQLGELAQTFYDDIPEGITLHGDWAANDQTCTFALMETENSALLDDIQAPFEGFVNIEVIPVTEVKGWGKR